jgi:transporter family protein
MFNAYFFAGIAMVLWGIAPIFGKLGLSGTQPLTALTIRSLLISAILVLVMTASGQWYNVSGVTAKEIVLIGFEGICAALLGQIAYYYALKFGEVGYISPIVSAFPIVAMVLGVVFLGEKISIAKIVAATLITAGIVLLRF